MSAERLPTVGASHPDSGQVTRIENLAVGFTPEALTKRVNTVLDKFKLTGVEGKVFGHLFNLRTREDRRGFTLQSPPIPKPWDSAENFVPNLHAQVDMQSEWLANGQIIWMDKTNMWVPYNEIGNAQKVSIVLDELLSEIEAAETPTKNR